MSKVKPNKKILSAMVLFEHVTPWLTFREKVQNNAFDRFKFNHSNFNTMLMMQVMCTVYFILLTLSAIMIRISFMTVASVIVAVCFPLTIGWLMIILRWWNFTKLLPKVRNDKIQPIVTYLESVWIVGTCFSASLCIAVIAHNGPCKDMAAGGEFRDVGCNYNSPHQMPEFLMTVVLILPALTHMMVKSAKWEFVVFSAAITFTSMILIMHFYDLTISFGAWVLFIPICLLVMYEHQRQTIEVFLLSQNQENLLRENERLAEETHANELRHMIGNVAHDLKTPLSAFMSGMDVISTELTSMSPSPGLIAVRDSLQNMKHVNEFMLMTINRCIDYTKASQGLKLVPRMETINFAEAINLPLRCMKDLQQDGKISIQLTPFTSEIAEQIITDKQWLQENILCLLSNAVKYSDNGAVTISAFLSEQPHQEADSPRHTRNKPKPKPQLETIDQQDNIEDLSLSFVPTVLIEQVREAMQPMIRIEIQDSGIGISEDMMTNLFNPFKQAQRLAGGTGLGLYSLARRIEAIQGGYGVRRRDDGKQGSVFWFTVPYRPDTSQSTTLFRRVASLDNSPRGTDHHPTSEKQSAKLNILIVDDSLSILKMSGMMLRRQGHTIATAENGAVAVDMIIAAIVIGASYDVVLMDLQMPVMDGLEATSRIRALEKAAVDGMEDSVTLLGCETVSASLSVDLLSHFNEPDVTPISDIPARHQLIIGVSANSDNETMEAAFAAGIDAFIPKPFTMQSFKDTYLGLQHKVDRK